jgi:hypothetical protein
VCVRVEGGPHGGGSMIVGSHMAYLCMGVRMQAGALRGGLFV